MMQIQWLAPIYLWLSPLLCIIIGVIMYKTASQCALARTLVDDQHMSSLLLHFSLHKKIIKAILFAVGIIGLWIALARPAGNESKQTVAQEGRDLFIALDISRSMLAQDRSPNRLLFAKQKIKSLLQALHAERVGLIVFSGSTFVQCPLTSDYGAFSMYLDQLDVETISSGTTALDQAIVCALDAFKKAGDRKNKLLVIFTDGEDFSSNLSGVKQRAVESGMNILTVGVGTVNGAPIPLYDLHGNAIGHQKDHLGAVVISRLNEGILRNLATDSGGVYVQAHDADDDIQQIVKSLSRFEKERLDDVSFNELTEYYHYPLCISFISFALEWIL